MFRFCRIGVQSTYTYTWLIFSPSYPCLLKSKWSPQTKLGAPLLWSTHYAHTLHSCFQFPNPKRSPYAGVRSRDSQSWYTYRKEHVQLSALIGKSRTRVHRNSLKMLSLDCCLFMAWRCSIIFYSTRPLKYLPLYYNAGGFSLFWHMNDDGIGCYFCRTEWRLAAESILTSTRSIFV